MSLKDTLKPVLVPIHREGYKFIAIFAVVTLILFKMSCFSGYIGVILTAWCAYFFRDPDRVTPQGKSLIISPADGVVQEITEAAPPAELGLGDAKRVRVSVFMNTFNVHVNRSPFEGVVTKIAYKAGKFLNASLDKASEDNERNSLIITLPGSKDIVVTQIAGLVARRIVSWVNEGQELKAGERFGMIRFGSRVDVYLPSGAEVKVLAGQTSVAGETVIATI